MHTNVYVFHGLYFKISLSELTNLLPLLLDCIGRLVVTSEGTRTGVVVGAGTGTGVGFSSVVVDAGTGTGVGFSAVVVDAGAGTGEIVGAGIVNVICFGCVVVGVGTGAGTFVLGIGTESCVVGTGRDTENSPCVVSPGVVGKH